MALYDTKLFIFGGYNTEGYCSNNIISIELGIVVFINIVIYISKSFFIIFGGNLNSNIFFYYIDN